MRLKWFLIGAITASVVWAVIITGFGHQLINSILS